MKKKTINLPAELRANYIDSRDIIELREELEQTLEQPPRHIDDMGLFILLRDICGEGEAYAPDWEYGALLIADHAFVDYAQEWAHDAGLVDADAPWPSYYIDWVKAARDLRMDYCGIDIGGTTYWVRG